MASLVSTCSTFVAESWMQLSEIYKLDNISLWLFRFLVISKAQEHRTQWHWSNPSFWLLRVTLHCQIRGFRIRDHSLVSITCYCLLVYICDSFVHRLLGTWNLHIKEEIFWNTKIKKKKIVARWFRCASLRFDSVCVHWSHSWKRLNL